MPTILCVDDQQPHLLLRQQMLEVIGYRTLIATSARAAVRLLAHENIDLAIIDFNLGGINGDVLARHMRKRRPNLPLIMLSGNPLVPESAKGTVDVFIAKGGSTEELLGAIAGYVGRPKRKSGEEIARTWWNSRFPASASTAGKQVRRRSA
jgi:CheY-like chemotaxis protein